MSTTPTATPIRRPGARGGRHSCTAFEQHLSPLAPAKMWGLSGDYIRDRFRHEPGMIVIEHPEEMNKRGWSKILIPASVAARVNSEMNVA